MRINLKKTLNWTKRVRIAQAATKIDITPTSDTPAVIVYTFGLETLHVPHSEGEWNKAMVVLEANRHTTSSFARIEVGLVREVSAKSPIQYHGPLNSFLGDKDISFTIKVISRNNGRLLAEGKNLHAGDSPADREELLPVRCLDLGQETWRVAWEANGPILQVNSRLHDAESFVKRDAAALGTVAPAALRIVLLRLATDPDAHEEDWSIPWHEFVSKFNGSELPELQDSWDSAQEWADRIVEAFANRHAFADRVNDQLAPGGE